VKRINNFAYYLRTVTRTKRFAEVSKNLLYYIYYIIYYIYYINLLY